VLASNRWISCDAEATASCPTEKAPVANP